MQFSKKIVSAILIFGVSIPTFSIPKELDMILWFPPNVQEDSQKRNLRLKANDNIIIPMLSVDMIAESLFGVHELTIPLFDKKTQKIKYSEIDRLYQYKEGNLILIDKKEIAYLCKDRFSSEDAAKELVSCN